MPEDKLYAAYIELRRTVDSREERIQYVFLPPHPEQRIYDLWPTRRTSSTHAACQGLADRFVVWSRRQDHAEHRSRWTRLSPYPKHATHAIAGSLIAPFVTNRATQPWRPSPVVTATLETRVAVKLSLSPSTPYPALNRLKSQAMRVHGLDIS